VSGQVTARCKQFAPILYFLHAIGRYLAGTSSLVQRQEMLLSWFMDGTNSRDLPATGENASSI
jgi:hypothetical protein